MCLFFFFNSIKVFMVKKMIKAGKIKTVSTIFWKNSTIYKPITRTLKKSPCNVQIVSGLVPSVNVNILWRNILVYALLGCWHAPIIKSIRYRFGFLRCLCFSTVRYISLKADVWWSVITITKTYLKSCLVSSYITGYIHSQNVF